MGISTHVLDIARGKPAEAVAITLEHLVAGEWREIANVITDSDGRCPNLLNSTPLEASRYRLIFLTGAYFAARRIEGLYPLVAIEFEVRDPAQHHHIPLLLAPNGYSTYRGS